MNLIPHKDAEIQEYKSRGGKLPKGKTFIEVRVNAKCTLPVGMQGSPFDPKDFVEKRLTGRLFTQSLGQPKFAFAGVASSIYAKVIHHQCPPGKVSSDTFTVLIHVLLFLHRHI